mmetsp:Transcript_40051/g.81809  ORF Transcript_40051/g.81809 Transcript_40051/m.81809 type:complete len:241 (+) Transcript_40051:1292-2014(+)
MVAATERLRTVILNRERTVLGAEDAGALGFDFLEAGLGLEPVLGSDVLQRIRDGIKASKVLGLLPPERGVKLSQLDQKRVEVLPASFGDLLDQRAQVRRKQLVLPPRVHQLLLVPLELLRFLGVDNFPLRHFHVRRLPQPLHLGTVVVQVNPQHLCLFQSRRHPRHHHLLPLNRVVDHEFLVPIGVHGVPRAHGGVDRRVVIRVPRRSLRGAVLAGDATRDVRDGGPVAHGGDRLCHLEP